MNRNRALLLVILILWFGAPISSASAHADLVAATPGRGAHLTALPSQVKLEFEENLLSLGNAKTNIVTVTDSAGREIEKADSKLSGRFLTVSLNPAGVSGTFTVNWRVVSGDGHPVKGSYQFSVGSATQVAPSPIPTTGSPTDVKESLWNQYEPRILLGIGALIALFIWARFKFLEKKSENQGAQKGS